MITLSTLKEATLQEIFEQAARHLLTQNKKSVDANGMCVYRKLEGDACLKCAVGIFISDDEYQKSFENKAQSSITGLNPGCERSMLLYMLQKMHDCNDPEFWRNNLFNIGLRNGLNVSFIEKEFPSEASV